MTDVKEIKQYPRTQVLDLRWNDISKIEGLDELQDLRELILSYNKITSIEGLENLNKLEVLWLNGNQINQIQGLDNLHALKTLWIAENQLLKINGLENLNSLDYLWLGNNRITQIEGLEHLTHLYELDLSNNHITMIEGVDTLSKFKKLDLRGNPITAVDQAIKLLEIPSLKDISIDYNKLNGVTQGNRQLVVEFLQRTYLRFKKICDLDRQKEIRQDKHKWNLDNFIGIANIFINLLHERGEFLQDQVWRQLERSLDERMKIEENKTEKIRLHAFKFVLQASTTPLYQKQIENLTRAVDLFHQADEYVCELVYRAHLCLLQTQMAISKNDWESAEEERKKLLALYENIQETMVSPSIRKYVEEVSDIHSKIADYVKEPRHLQRLKQEAEAKCQIILMKVAPTLHFQHPVLSGILWNIARNLLEEINRSDRASEYFTLAQESLFASVSRIETFLREVVESVMKDNFGEDWIDKCLEEKEREEIKKRWRKGLEQNPAHRIVFEFNFSHYNNIMRGKRKLFFSNALGKFYEDIVRGTERVREIRNNIDHSKWHLINFDLAQGEADLLAMKLDSSLAKIRKERATPKSTGSI